MRKQRTIERVIAGFGRALRWLGLTILPVMVVTLSGSSRALGYAPVCDALGRLAERRTSGDTVTTNRMDYAGWQLIAEYNQAGTLVCKYVYGDGLDEPVRMAGGTKRYYYHPDALGSVATITTNNGLKAESYTYDAYGTPTIYSGAGTIITSSLMTNRLLFTSRDYNATTTLYHYRYRYYSPTVGRFLQPDPIHLAGGDLNLYRYVYNNPVNASDPFGLADTWGGAVADWVDNSVNSTLGRVNTKWVEVNLPIALVENGLKGFGDLLRFGDGLANAFYNTDSDWLDRLTVASADFGRAGGIILIATPFLCKGAPAAPTSPKLLGPGTHFGAKIEGQLAKRGWTKDLVQSAIDNPSRTVAWKDTCHLPGGRTVSEPATAYYSQRGGYVVRNNRTGDIVQVSKRSEQGWKAPWD